MNKKILRRFFVRLTAPLTRHRDEARLREELEQHLALQTEANIRAGLTPEEARRQAILKFGAVEAVKDEYRDERSVAVFEQLAQDMRYALRGLRKDPGVTIVAVLTLSLGIGANTAIFTVANALLFSDPIGVAAPGRLIDIGVVRGDGGLNPLQVHTFVEIRKRAATFDNVFGYQLHPAALSLQMDGGDRAERIFGHAVTLNYFSALGATPVRGRFFDERSAFDPDVVVLSHAFWMRRFGADPDIVGRSFRLNGRRVSVAAVATEGFQGTGLASPDLWFPLPATSSGRGSVMAGARLKPAASVERAASELQAISQILEREQGDPIVLLGALPASRAAGNRNITVGIAVALMILVSLVLAIACANVAGISLARAVARRRELAVRVALGASRWRLARQLLTETCLLFAIGGAVGLLLAHALMRSLSIVPLIPIPVAVSFPLDVRVVLFTGGLSLIASLLSGLAPAVTASQADPIGAMKAASIAIVSGSRMRAGLVTGQVAVSVLLLVLAGLFVRVLQHAGATNPGFDPTGIELATVDLGMGNYTESAKMKFWQELLERVRRSRRITEAALARVSPGGFEGISLGDVRRPGITPRDDERIFPSWNIVENGYFRTLGIALVAGRDFSAGDRDGSPPVAIVSQNLARRLWPDEPAIGQLISQQSFSASESKRPLPRRDLLVVGVAQDVRTSSLIDGFADTFVYVPLQQNHSSAFTTQMTIVARSGNSDRLVSELQRVLADLDSSLVFVRSETLEEAMAYGLMPQRVVAWIGGTLGVVGLILAGIGIYGLIAHAVARRVREIGVRMALGAERRTILTMVLRDGLTIIGLGSLVGLVCAAGISSILAVFLFGLAPVHIPTFAGAILLFDFVGLLACYVPARRAARVDPLVALRYE